MGKLAVKSPEKNKKYEATSRDIGILRLNELLVGLNNKIFGAFCKECEFSFFSEGEPLIEEHEHELRTFFIISGDVHIIHTGEGGAYILFRELGSGDWFGEVAALDKGLRTASAHAVSDCVAASVERDVFVNLLLENRQIAVKVLDTLAAHIRMTTKRFTKVSAYTGVQRVYLQLLDMAKPSPVGDGTWIVNHMPSHEQMSLEAFTSKGAVAQALGKICQGNIAKRSVGTLKILDRDALERLTNEL